jgi:hypothetical protein
MLAAGQAMLDGIKQTSNPAELKSLRADLARQRDQLERKLPDVEDEAAGMRTWHRRLYIAATVLPKTSETKRLFQRYVVGKEDQEGFLKFIAEQSGDPGNRALEDVLNQRSLLWVLGTSLGFEAVVLALACWIFARRDF